ncbi:unnamed protein product [Oikopleura dioica]|uniref:Uncharacterized protein n=1 Tax=Oikopleura dioica TaxID=34765 RepID=E4XXV8_OIKDI|nr:unnamed protein product [Oikopleura dioica]
MENALSTNLASYVVALMDTLDQIVKVYRYPISTENANDVKNYAKKNCPDEKIWMGYETKNKQHFWLDDDLEMVNPVPDGHIKGTKSIGCNYFDNTSKEAVPYLKIKKDGKVECKVHDVHEHEHNCVCMSHLRF